MFSFYENCPAKFSDIAGQQLQIYKYSLKIAVNKLNQVCFTILFFHIHFIIQFFELIKGL